MSSDTHPYHYVMKAYVCVNPRAKSFQGKRLHLKSIADGLRRLQPDYKYAIHALAYWNSHDHQYYHGETVSKLTSATVLLAGLLDALVICSLDEGVTPQPSNMSFKNTPFENPALSIIQEQVKALRSPPPSESKVTVYADFWTIADFWRHYLPCLPYPYRFKEDTDFQLNLGSVCSGPLLRDLIVPTFNHACSLVELLGRHLDVPEEEWSVSRLDF